MYAIRSYYAEETILTPYTELNLTNPIYQAGMAYHKRRIKEDVTDLENTQADRDEITGTVGMNPPRITSYNVCYTKLLRHMSS